VDIALPNSVITPLTTQIELTTSRRRAGAEDVPSHDRLSDRAHILSISAGKRMTARATWLAGIDLKCNF